jgi:hypothetical protein
MKVLKIFFLFIAIAVVTGGITTPLWWDKALPYFSELIDTSNPDTFPEINQTIPDAYKKVATNFDLNELRCVY